MGNLLSFQCARKLHDRGADRRLQPEGHAPAAEHPVLHRKSDHVYPSRGSSIRNCKEELAFLTAKHWSVSLLRRFLTHLLDVTVVTVTLRHISWFPGPSSSLYGCSSLLLYEFTVHSFSTQLFHSSARSKQLALTFPPTFFSRQCSNMFNRCAQAVHCSVIWMFM